MTSGMEGDEKKTRQHRTSLSSVIQEKEVELEVTSTIGDDVLSKLREVSRAYWVDYGERLTKPLRTQNEQLEAQVKHLAENLESEKAKRLELETEVKLSEQNREIEKTKRVAMKVDDEKFQFVLSNLREASRASWMDYEERLTKPLRKKTEQLEAEVKCLAENLESEKVKRWRFETDVKLSKHTLDIEKKKRVKLEEDVKFFERSLESERTKMLCIICMERDRDTLILPCTHFHCCNVCLLDHKKRSNTCPVCRGLISALLHCQLSVS